LADCDASRFEEDYPADVVRYQSAKKIAALKVASRHRSSRAKSTTVL